MWDKSLLTMRNPRAAVTINHTPQINGCICNTFLHMEVNYYGSTTQLNSYEL